MPEPVRCALVSGGFDPLHSGHLQCFKEARDHADYLVVGLNSDEWLTRKKGKPFMSFEERKTLLENLEMVDEVISFKDSDDTACTAIAQLIPRFDKVVFANGGDRSSYVETPEYQHFRKHPKVKFVWAIGGANKKNSSSWILDEWKTQRTSRDWGYWRVLDEKPDVKVKELVINPEASLSDQRHQYRSEYWYVLEGSVSIVIESDKGSKFLVELEQHMSYLIPNNTWHLASNYSAEPVHILEIQYGTECSEEDIERR